MVLAFEEVHVDRSIHGCPRPRRPALLATQPALQHLAQGERILTLEINSVGREERAQRLDDSRALRAHGVQERRCVRLLKCNCASERTAPAAARGLMIPQPTA